MAEQTERIAILLDLEKAKFEKNAKSAEAAIGRLERKFSPLAAAEQRMKKEQDRLNAALEAGTITAKRHATGMNLLQKQYDETVARVNGLRGAVVNMNSSLRANGNFMNRNKEVFRQAGYQVGDFAVQVQGGTSVMTAFTQQGSQLLGVLGPWGAVMGAVLAVGAPLAGVLLGLSAATEAAKEKAKTFAERVSEAEAALSAMASTAGKISSGDLETLRKKYGELTDEVRAMALELFAIDKREALKKVAVVIKDVTSEIAKAAEASSGVVAAAIAQSGTEAGKAEAKAYRAEIEKMQGIIDARKASGQFIDPGEIKILQQMREELAAMEGNLANIGSLSTEINISPDLLRQISEAQAGLEGAREAGDFSAMADQLGLIRSLLAEAGDTVDQKVLDGVTQAEAVARSMAARLNDGKVAAEELANADIASGISTAADAAMKLAKNLGISLEIARTLVANEAQANSAGRGRGGDPRTFGGSAKDIQKNDIAAQLAYQTDAPKGTSGRAAGSSKRTSMFDVAEGELEKLKRQVELLGKSKGEIAALTIKYKLMDEAKSRGIEITDDLASKIDAEARSVGDLADKYELARDKVAAMEKIQSDWKNSIIDAAMGGVNAMDQFVNSIKRAAIEYALFGTGMFSGGGNTSGGFSGLLGGLLNFDGGGYTGNMARSGGLDGKGGMLAMVHPRETVIDHTKGGGVSQSGSSVVRVDLGPGLVGNILSQARGASVEITQSGISEYDRTVVPRRIGQVMSDPRKIG